VKTKQVGREIQPVKAPQPTNVVNLMDALRRSIEAEKAGATRSKSPEPQRPDLREPARQRRAAAAARDKVRQSPRSKKAK
jgi:DNA end-binding protein Ku